MSLNDQRVEILLKEYDVCSRDAAGLDNRLWQITSIFAVLITAVFGFVIQIDRPQNQGQDAGIIVLGLIVIILSLAWIPLYWSRRRIINIRYFRLREIEIQLRMRTNLYIHTIGDWDRITTEDPLQSAEASWHYSLSDSEKRRLKDFRQCVLLRMPPRFALGLGNESGDFAMHIPAILGILAGIGILIIELWGALSSFVFFAGAHFFVAVGILLIIELMPAPTFFGLLVGISIIVVEVSKLGA